MAVEETAWRKTHAVYRSIKLPSVDVCQLQLIVNEPNDCPSLLYARYNIPTWHAWLLSIYIIHKIISYYYYHNFTDVETEAQKEQIFCLWAYTYKQSQGLSLPVSFHSLSL